MSQPASRGQLVATGGLLLLAVSASVLNCDGDTTEVSRGDPVAERAMLADLAAEVFDPTHARFRVAAEALRDATSVLEDDPSSLAGAQDAWRTAMAAWQTAEVMQIGPAGGPTRTGGRSLRDEIYSWPTVHPCRVDQVLVSKAYAEADFFEASVVNVYGLDALEYLLFYDGAENACPPQVAINEEGAWAALDEAELRVRRAAYAAVVAAGLVQVARQLESAWAPDGDDFASGLARAGESGSPYESSGEALTELLLAMLYLDPYTKDVKLGVPAGLSDCEAETCPEKVELWWARDSATAVAANLSGVAQLVGGPEPKRLRGLLVGAGATDVADALASDLDVASERVAALGGDLTAALADDAEAVRAAHTALGEVTTRLKVDVAIALTLPLPREGAGDSD